MEIALVWATGNPGPPNPPTPYFSIARWYETSLILNLGNGKTRAIVIIIRTIPNIHSRAIVRGWSNMSQGEKTWLGVAQASRLGLPNPAYI